MSWEIIIHPFTIIASASQPRPTPQQRAWQELEVGLFIHFGPATWQATDYDDLSTPLTRMNPALLDTDAWAQAAVAAGARYILMVAKHSGGFCWWPTETTDYSVAHIPWRNGAGDLLADVRRSCDAYGLRLGIYVSPEDARHGAAVGGKCATPEAQAAYPAIYRRQLTEVLRDYGPVVEVWFDGSLTIPVGDILEQYATEAVILQGPHASMRWNGNETGITPYPSWTTVWQRDRDTGLSTARHGHPDGDCWMPLESDFPIRKHWFWHPGVEDSVMSVDALVQRYYTSVGRGTQMVFNLTPDTTGRLSEPDVSRAVQMGAELRRRFSHPVVETRGEGPVLELRLPDTRVIDHVILMEDIAHGERVREYVVEGETGGEWAELCRGSMIGHKRIQSFTAARISAVRVCVLAATDMPRWRQFAVYATGVPTPVELPEIPEYWEAERLTWLTAYHVKTEWTTLDVPIDACCCPVAGQYRLWAELDPAYTPLDIQSVVLMQDGRAYPECVEPLAEPGQYGLNITGISARLTVRLVMRAHHGEFGVGKLMLSGMAGKPQGIR